jgi:hypothetical protein
MGNRAEELAVYGKPGKRWCCFPPFPQTLEIARREHRNMKILRSDSHIPSAPAASMNQFQIPKGQNPLRLPFASFRLIFGLEKTASGPNEASNAAGLLYPLHWPEPTKRQRGAPHMPQLYVIVLAILVVVLPAIALYRTSQLKTKCYECPRHETQETL